MTELLPILTLITGAILGAALFVAGVFFGAWLQKRVSLGQFITAPRIPGVPGLSGAKPSVEAEDEARYESPYSGYKM